MNQVVLKRRLPCCRVSFVDVTVHVVLEKEGHAANPIPFFQLAEGHAEVCDTVFWLMY